MFMVIIFICTLHSCFDYTFHVRMSGSVQECVLKMVTTAVTLHIQRPDWNIRNISCIPVAET